MYRYPNPRKLEKINPFPFNLRLFPSLILSPQEYWVHPTEKSARKSMTFIRYTIHLFKDLILPMIQMNIQSKYLKVIIFNTTTNIMKEMLVRIYISRQYFINILQEALRDCQH